MGPQASDRSRNITPQQNLDKEPVSGEAGTRVGAEVCKPKKDLELQVRPLLAHSHSRLCTGTLLEPSIFPDLSVPFHQGQGEGTWPQSPPSQQG